MSETYGYEDEAVYDDTSYASDYTETETTYEEPSTYDVAETTTEDESYDVAQTTTEDESYDVAQTTTEDESYDVAQTTTEDESYDVAESAYVEQSTSDDPETTLMEQPGFEGADYDEVLYIDPGAVAGPYVDEQGQACWCCATPPDTWDSWAPQTEPTADSWAEEGWSTDWGSVDAGWPSAGEDLYPVTGQEQQPFSDLIGPGHAADIFWRDQGETNYCALYSVRATLSELYGYDVDVNEIIQRAENNNWLVKDELGEVKGVSPDHLDDIFASYGVPSRNLSGEANASCSASTARSSTRVPTSAMKPESSTWIMPSRSPASTTREGWRS
jgi:hypothetical protein